MDYQKYLGVTVANKWKIDDYVGQGRYGMVFKAHGQNNSVVAVKIIELPTEELIKEFNNAYGGDSEELENFVSEVANKFVAETESMMRISSNDACQNIIRYIDHTVIKNDIYWKIYIVMEFATPLRKYIANKTLTVRDALDLGIDIAAGLEKCHSLKIIHRDVKEDNIFFGENGKFKIGDFGVANMTTASRGITQGVGSEYYMAPEVRKGEQYTGSVDLYSLGIVLYKLFNYNRYPFMPKTTETKFIKMDDNEVAFKKRMSGEQVPAPEFSPKELTPVIQKACSYYKDDRYYTAEDMKHDLLAVRDLLPDDVLDSQIPYPNKRPVTRKEIPRKQAPEPEPAPAKNKNANSDGMTKSIFDETQGLGSGSGRTYSNPNQQVLSWEPSAQNDGDYYSENSEIDGESTVSIIHSLGTNSKASQKIIEKSRQLEEEMIRGKAKQRRIKKLKAGIISAAAVVALLVVALIFIWPQTAQYRAEKADGYAIHKYRFGIDLGRIQKNDDEVIGAYYLDSNDKEYLYFSQKEEELVPTGTIQDSPLYKIKRDGTGLEKISDKHCEYDIYYDGWIYFVSYYEDRALCRVRSDGTYDTKTDGSAEGVILSGKPIASLKMVENGIFEIRFDPEIDENGQEIEIVQKYDVRNAKDDYTKIIEVTE